METPLLLLLLLPALLPGCLCAVTVSVPPTEIGQEAIFRCTPDSSSPAKYSVEWSFLDQDGIREQIVTYTEGVTQVDQDTQFSGRAAVRSDNSLVIRDVGVKDEGTFYCRLTPGSEGSARLKVFVAPAAPELSVIGQIISITSSDASEVATCVSRNTYPAPSIEWFKNQMPLNAGSEKNKVLYTTSRTTTEASGLYTVSNTLFMKPAKEDANAVFSCQAVFPLQSGGTSNMESKEFKLNLHYFTENVLFTVSPSQHIKEGDTVTLRCVGDGYPPPTYVLQKLKGTEYEDLPFGSDGNHVFQNISREDAGNYSCEALDFDSPDGTDLIRKLFIHVHYLNPISVIPAEQSKHNIGGEAMLFCACDGSDSVSIAWKKGDTVVSRNSRHKLQKLTYSDSGVYTCEVTVPSVPGLRKEKDITIVVEGEPELDMSNEAVEVPSEGHQVTLSCAAEGYPVPKITWSQPDLKASESIKNFKVVSEVSMKFSSKLMNNISCSAKNHLGTKVKKFSLSMSPAPSVAPAQEQSGGSSTAIIAVVVCVLLLLLVVALFYFLQKKGKLSCGRSEKLPLNQDPASAELAVELKSEKRHDQHGLLGGGGGGSGAEC